MVKGSVTKITSYGAFVELNNGIDGLIHVTQLSDKKVAKIKDVVNLGDEVEARVVKIDTDERRIALSMRKNARGEMPNVPTSNEKLGDMKDIFDSALEGLEVQSED